MMTVQPGLLVAALLVLGAISAPAQTPLPACMHGTILPPFGDPGQGSMQLWPNGVGPDATAGYHFPSFVISPSSPPLMGPLSSDPLVANFVDDPVFTTNGGQSLFVYVRSPLELGSAGVATMVQSFAGALTITNWCPETPHFLFLFLRVNGSPWTLVGEFELANAAVPGIGSLAGPCAEPVVQNVGWWTGLLTVTAGAVTQERPAAAWVGVRTGVSGLFNPGDVVEVAGVWAVEQLGVPPGGLATLYLPQSFQTTVVAY